MCDKRSTVNLKLPSGKTFRVDPCMRELIQQLNKDGVQTVACCCGHGIYPETVVFKVSSSPLMFSVFVHTKKFPHHKALPIPRTRNFYKMDKNGFYYIPETLNPKDAQEKTT